MKLSVHSHKLGNYCRYFETTANSTELRFISQWRASRRSDTTLPLAGIFQAGCVPEERFPCRTACVTFLPLRWHSLHLETSGRTGRSVFVCLFGFRYTFPCLGWARALPLSCSQIRIINWSNFWAHSDIGGQSCNWRFSENIHPRFLLLLVFVFFVVLHFFIWHEREQGQDMFMAAIWNCNKRRLSTAVPKGWRRKLPLVKIAWYC